MNILKQESAYACMGNENIRIREVKEVVITFKLNFQQYKNVSTVVTSQMHPVYASMQVQCTECSLAHTAAYYTVLNIIISKAHNNAFKLSDRTKGLTMFKSIIPLN